MVSKEIINSFNEKELQVYQYVEANKEKVGYMRIRELAQACDVSTATVLRFVKKMGLENYNAFKYWCHQQEETTTTMYHTKEILECVEKLDTPYYKELIEEAVDIIEASDFVIFAGIGNSGGIAHYGARCFSNAGTYALCQDDPFYNTKCVKGNPVIIILSVSGETKEMIQQVSGYHSKGCTMITISTTSSGTLCKLSDLTIAYHIKYRATQPQTDFSSQIPAVYLIEMMAHELLQRNHDTHSA